VERAEGRAFDGISVVVGTQLNVEINVTAGDAMP
jgi:hypothetical protein